MAIHKAIMRACLLFVPFVLPRLPFFSFLPATPLALPPPPSPPLPSPPCALQLCLSSPFLALSFPALSPPKSTRRSPLPTRCAFETSRSHRNTVRGRCRRRSPIGSRLPRGSHFWKTGTTWVTTRANTPPNDRWNRWLHLVDVDFLRLG
jgi:hypothetical protein